MFEESNDSEESKIKEDQDTEEINFVLENLHKNNGAKLTIAEK